MAQTSILLIDQLTPSQAAKETTINTAVSALERAGNARRDVNLAAGDVSLTASEFTRNAFFRFFGHAAARSVTLPTAGTDRLFFVRNVGTADVNVVGPSNTVVIPDGEGFVVHFSSTTGLTLVLGGSASGGGEDPGGPTDPVDYGIVLNLSGGNYATSEADYLKYRLFTVQGNTVARTLSFPDGVENVVAVKNEGSSTLTVAANSGSVSVAAGETIQVATSLTAIVKVSGSSSGGGGGTPDYGMVLDATSGNVAVNSTDFAEKTLYQVTGNTVSRTLTFPNGIERTFVIYNAGSFTLNVSANSTTITVPAGESRAVYTTLTDFKAVTDQVGSGGGGGSFTPGAWSAIKQVDMSTGNIVLTTTDMTDYNVVMVTAASTTAATRTLTIPNTINKAFVVANASPYDITVQCADSSPSNLIVVPTGYAEFFVQHNVPGSVRAFQVNRKYPARHLKTFSKDGVLGASNVIGRFVAANAMTVKGTDIGPAYIRLGTGPSGTSFSVVLAKNGATIATMTFGSGETIKTWGTLDFTLAAGDRLTLTTGAGADAAAADIDITIPLRDVSIY